MNRHKILERCFRLNENETTVRTEVLAGLTTFLTMAYIIFLQPAVLTTDFAGQPTGLDYGAMLLATCVISGLASIFMGLYARYPIALAPGMGENFFFVSVIMALGATGVQDAWQVALGIVFIAGVAFLVLSVLRVREAIINVVSPSLRNAIATAIGIFIAFIGLKNGGLIVSHPGTLVALSPTLLSTDVAVFVVGLFVAAALQTRRIRGAILWGIAAATLTAIALHKVHFQGVFGLPLIEHSSVMKMNLGAAFSVKYIPFIIVFLFMDMFDTIGTLVGVAEQGGFVKDNRLPRANRVLLVDAVGTVAGACMGTSTVTSYIESATGIAYGGRTGLTSVVVGLLFFGALLFSPIIGMIGGYVPITASALVIVGAMMMTNVRRIDWDDFSEAIPAFLIILGIPLTFSIADGLAMGFISYPIIKLLSGKGKQVGVVMYALAVILLLYFIFIRPQINT